MKFVKECTPEGLLLPPAAMRLAGLGAGGKAEYHTRKGALRLNASGVQGGMRTAFI